MTSADKQEIRELLMSNLDHIKETIDMKISSLDDTVNLKLINVEQKIDYSIKKLEETVVQTTKTNGSVRTQGERITSLEGRIPHTLANCPQQPIIMEMRDDMITRKSIKKMLVTVVAVIGSIVAIIAAIVAIIQDKII